MWGNQGLCGNFATNSNDAPTRGENVGTLLLARREELGSKLCFRLIEEKIAGKNENVCVKIHRIFFILLCVHKIDHPLNSSMNRIVEQLAENSGEKKELFKELK